MSDTLINNILQNGKKIEKLKKQIKRDMKKMIPSLAECDMVTFKKLIGYKKLFTNYGSEYTYNDIKYTYAMRRYINKNFSKKYLNNLQEIVDKSYVNCKIENSSESDTYYKRVDIYFGEIDFSYIYHVDYQNIDHCYCIVCGEYYDDCDGVTPYDVTCCEIKAIELYVNENCGDYNGKYLFELLEFLLINYFKYIKD